MKLKTTVKESEIRAQLAKHLKPTSTVLINLINNAIKTITFETDNDADVFVLQVNDYSCNVCVSAEPTMVKRWEVRYTLLDKEIVALFEHEYEAANAVDRLQNTHSVTATKTEVSIPEPE